MSSQMDIDHDVPTVLATLRLEADPELVPLFYTMEDLWERKYVVLVYINCLNNFDPFFFFSNFLIFQVVASTHRHSQRVLR